MNDINDQDKLMAALAWVLWPIVPLIILIAEDMRNRPFQKYHAVNSLVFTTIFFFVATIISVVTCGLGTIVFLALLIIFYWAYQAYQGEWVEVPGLTNFIKGQGWV